MNSTCAVPGEHNVGERDRRDCGWDRAGCSSERFAKRWPDFNGVDRRFQMIGTADGVTVVDDYGHHPTEIRATLAAARQCGFRKDARHLPAASLHPDAVAAG